MAKPTDEAVQAVVEVIRETIYPLDGRHVERYARAVLTFLDEHPEHLGLRREQDVWDPRDPSYIPRSRLVGPWQEAPSAQ